MKKLLIPMCAMLLLATSCKTTKAIFKQTEVQQNYYDNDYDMSVSPVAEKKSSYVYNSLVKTEKLPTDFGVTKTIADLQVSPVKNEYTCLYNGVDDASGRKAAVNYAINQALNVNGRADVLLDPKYEIQSEDGRIKSVKVSGYVATYCNFRTATKDDLKMLKEGNTNTQVVPKTSQQE